MTTQKRPNILLYGAGSCGAVFLYQLLQAGCTVTTVCRSNYQSVKDNGFSLISVRFGNVSFKPTNVVRNLSECADVKFDYILVCTKSFPEAKPSLAEQLRPVLGGNENVAIVLAQNGVMIEEEIAVSYPKNPVLSGVVYLPAVQTDPGTVEYPEMLNLIEVGTYPASAPVSHQDLAKQLVDLMVKGGGEATYYADIQTARWSKLLMNAAWNPIGALTLTNDGDFLLTSDPYAHELAWGIMMEIVKLAKAAGIPGVTEEVAKKRIAIAEGRAATGTGREMSMLQDVRQGRSFEVEAILGNAVRKARELGVSMPRVETLYALGRARLWAMTAGPRSR